MNKKRILHFPLRNNRGGITKYILENWRYINKDEFVFDFLTFEEQIDFKDELLAEGCKIHYISCTPRQDKERFYSEVRNILENDYDAFHIHTSRWTGTEFEEIAMSCGIPNVIIHSHNTDIGISPEKTQQYNFFVERHERIKTEVSSNWKQYATNLCACSDIAARWLFGNELADTEVLTLKNAIDINRYVFNENARRKYKQELNLTDCFVIGHVGRFETQKNHRFIISMFSELSRNLPSARLLLIGNGPDFENINTFAQECGVINKIRLLSLRGDVPELMQAMDVFILPSLHEGLPISLIEAQAAGLKCFVSDKVSTEAQILHDTQYLPLDELAWCSALIDAENKAFSRNDKSIEIDAAGFSINESVKVLEKLYRGEFRR